MFFQTCFIYSVFSLGADAILILGRNRNITNMNRAVGPAHGQSLCAMAKNAAMFGSTIPAMSGPAKARNLGGKQHRQPEYPSIGVCEFLERFIHYMQI